MPRTSRTPRTPRKSARADRASVRASFISHVGQQEAPSGPQPLKLPGLVNSGLTVGDIALPDMERRANPLAPAGHPNHPNRVCKTGSLRRRSAPNEGRSDTLKLPCVARQVPLGLVHGRSLLEPRGSIGVQLPEDSNEDVDAGLSRARPSLHEGGLLDEIENSIVDHDLSGPLALAFALIAKYGTLEEAWKQVDLNNSGNISRFEWDSALTRMHLDTDRLCGASANALFSQLSDGSDVTHDVWTSFFKPWIENPEASSGLQEALKQFESTCEEDRQTNDGKRGERAQRDRSRLAAHAQLSLKEAIDNEARMSKDDLAELEIQASAESLQLEEEIKDHNIVRAHALAYILIAKFGSFRKAFRWFNSNGSGRLSCNAWDTGIRILRVDLERLTGSTPEEFFKLMHEGDNFITLRNWIDFFTRAMETAPSGFADILAGAAGSAGASLGERAMLKKEQLACRAKLGKLSEEETSFRIWIREELSQLEFGKFAEFSSAEIPNLDERQLLIIEDVAMELGMFSQVLKGGRSDDSTEPDSIMVYNLGDFPQEARQKLRAIELNSSFQFPTNLSEIQRQVVHLMGRDLGLWTKTEGHPRHVIAFNVGDFVADVREQLKQLKKGESKAYPSDLSLAQRRIVHMIAEELGLASFSAGSGDARHVEVFNLASFADEVRTDLGNLKNGEQKTFGKDLSMAERKIVHCIADSLGLSHVSDGVGDQRQVTVGKLNEFSTWVRDVLEKLEVGSTTAFEARLSVLQRKIVHDTAKEFRMSSFSQGTGSERFVSVTRTEAACLSRQVSGGSESGDEDEDSEDAENWKRLFEDFASGHDHRERIFTRADLRSFIEDFQDVAPRKRRHNLPAVFNRLYEDSLQLQLDFGTRCKGGLTYRWFQVFIQKVAAEFGFSAMGLLVFLLDY